MAYRVLGLTEDVFRGYTARQGLEGPYIKGANRILYYDPRAGRYWDPLTDFYLTNDEVQYLDDEQRRLMTKE